MKEKNIYILSCVENGGIYRYIINEKCEINFAEKITVDRPMYSVISNNKLFIILRAPFVNANESGLVSFNIENGKLTEKSDVISTKGEVACHLCVDGDSVYIANYISGNIIRMPDNSIQHKGNSINQSRQSSPHAHYVGLTPDSKYICAVDLGLDKIIIYDRDLNFVSNVSVKAGNGARHLVFSNDGKYAYCANELSSTVTVFSYNDGKLSFENEYSTLPSDYKEINAPAAIRFYNGYVYISNRGHNSIAYYKAIENRLELIDIFDCGGNSPRDFNIWKNYLICTNEDSDNVVFFEIGKEKPIKLKELSVPKPLCICFKGDN